MTTVNYFVGVTKISSPQDAILKFSELGTDKHVWFLLERYSGYQVDELSKLPSDWSRDLISLTVCTEKWEVRVEKEDPAEQELTMRVIADEVSDANCQGRCRDFSYLTNYTKAIPQLQDQKLSKLLYREYFTDDPSSGMPLLKHSRLCGFAKE